MWVGPLLFRPRGPGVGLAGPEGLVGRDRPDEPGELAGARDDGLLTRFPAAGHPSHQRRCSRCWARHARSITTGS